MTEATSAIPNPGSIEAIQKGCKCPVIDNCHGRGYLGMSGIFVQNYDCPVHYPARNKVRSLEERE